MAGVKGRSGRRPRNEEEVKLAVVRKAWKLTNQKLDSTDKDRYSIARDIAIKDMWTKERVEQRLIKDEEKAILEKYTRKAPWFPPVHESPLVPIVNTDRDNTSIIDRANERSNSIVDKLIGVDARGIDASNQSNEQTINQSNGNGSSGSVNSGIGVGGIEMESRPSAEQIIDPASSSLKTVPIVSSLETPSSLDSSLDLESHINTNLSNNSVKSVELNETPPSSLLSSSPTPSSSLSPPPSLGDLEGT